MRFVTPHQYSQSSKAHLTINTNAVNQMVKFYPPLSAKDKVQGDKFSILTKDKVRGLVK